MIPERQVAVEGGLATDEDLVAPLDGVANIAAVASPCLGAGDRPTPALVDHPAASERVDAFRALIGDTLEASYRLAGVILGSSVEAEDAVADAALSAWRDFDRLRDRNSFDAWFGRILVNACRDRLRRRRGVRLVSIETVGDGLATPDPAGDAEDRAAVGLALESLDPDHRVVVVLRYWADLSVAEIAVRVGIPEGTVKSRLHNALARLRGALAEGEA